MKSETKEYFMNQIKGLPTELLGRRASDNDIKDFEEKFQPIPLCFQWILKNCGRVLIGSDFTDDIDELHVSHEKYNLEKMSKKGWKINNVFVIGWDGSGDPIGIEIDSGRILVEWHDVGEVSVLYQSIDDIYRS